MSDPEAAASSKSGAGSPTSGPAADSSGSGALVAVGEGCATVGAGSGGAGVDVGGGGVGVDVGAGSAAAGVVGATLESSVLELSPHAATATRTTAHAQSIAGLSMISVYHKHRRPSAWVLTRTHFVGPADHWISNRRRGVPQI